MLLELLVTCTYNYHHHMCVDIFKLYISLTVNSGLIYRNNGLLFTHTWNIHILHTST